MGPREAPGLLLDLPGTSGRSEGPGSDHCPAWSLPLPLMRLQGERKRHLLIRP